MRKPNILKENAVMRRIFISLLQFSHILVLGEFLRCAFDVVSCTFMPFGWKQSLYRTDMTI